MKNLKASFTVPLFAIVIYVFMFCTNAFSDKLMGTGGNDYLSVIILQLLIFILPSIIFCRLKGVGYTTKLNVRLFSPAKITAIIASALVLIFGSIIIRFVQIYVFDMSSFMFSPFARFVSKETEYNFLYSATAFAIIPALTEELVFRTIMLTEFNQGGYGAVNAVTITSVLSAFLFFTPESFPIRLLCAIVFSMLTYATGSSLTALISHLIFSIYSVFGERYVIRALRDPSNKVISIFTFAMLFLVILIVFFGELEHSLRQTGKAGTPSPSYLLKKTNDGKTPDIASSEKVESGKSKEAISDRSKKTLEALFSPTFLICIIIYVISLFGFKV